MVPDNLFGSPTNVTQLITAINPNGRPREDAEEEESGITLEQYAAAKRLPLDFLESLNLKDANYDFSPAVRIPYPNDLGKETYHRYRVALKAEPRFKAPPKHLGYKPIPYGLQVLKDAREMGYMLIVEGESDAQVLWYNDVPALGIPGVQAWKKFGKEWAGYLEGIPRLLVPVESDEGGERFWALLSTTERIRDRLRRVPITSPALKDIGALWSHAVDAGREDEFKSVLHGMVWIHSHADNLTIPNHVIDTVRATDVITKPISWLWNRRIPEGKLTMFDGDPDVGKSVVTMDIAARVSRGRAFPDGAVCAAGPVLICNVEDGMDDTIVPRLNAHGADLSRIFLFQSVPDAKGGTRLLELPQDILLLENAVARHQAKLLILDPVLTMLGGDANKDQDARKALAPIRDMAEKTGVAVVCVRHLNKNVSLSAIQRGGGNMGLIGVARAGSFFAQHPDDDRLRVMAPHKSNVAEKPPSLTYRLVTSEVHDTARVEWIGVTDHDANSLAAGPISPHEKSVLDEAIEFLRSQLENGPMWAKQVYKEAHDAGVSDASLRRAKAVLRVRSQKVGTDGWQWSLPEKHDPDPPDDGQKEHVEHVEHLQNFKNEDPENSAYIREGAQGAQGAQVGFDDEQVQKPVEHVRSYDLITEVAGIRQLAKEISSSHGPITIDTETSSLHVNEAKVRLIQIRTLTDSKPALVDCPAVDVRPLLDVLKDKPIMAHNAAYDLAVLASYYGYEHRGPVSDTMLMFQVFYGGTSKKAGLKDALKNVLDIDVSKAEQTADWSGELTPEMLDYAASDGQCLECCGFGFSAPWRASMVR